MLGRSRRARPTTLAAPTGLGDRLGVAPGPGPDAHARPPTDAAAADPNCILEDDMSTTETPLADGGSPPRRLVRDRDDRWLAGVCSGLARHFGMSPAIYRVAFAALTLAGGTGIALYVAAWLVIPDDDGAESIAVRALRERRERPWLIGGVGLLALGILVLLSSAHWWPAAPGLWLTAVLAGAAIIWWQVGQGRGGRANGAELAEVAEGAPVREPRRRRPSLFAPALGVLIAGLGLLGALSAAGWVDVDWTAAFALGAALAGVTVVAGALLHFRVLGVALLGLLLLVALALSAALPVRLSAGVGDELDHPRSAATLASSYEQSVGSLELDLRDVQLRPGRTSVAAELGVGHLLVHVPRGVTVVVHGRAGVGKVSLLGQVENGTGVSERVVSTRGSGRVLALDAHVGVGDVEVVRG
jgi:phage shock protein PspC (stress-responsive transcriptional regulator)